MCNVCFGLMYCIPVPTALTVNDLSIVLLYAYSYAVHRLFYSLLATVRTNSHIVVAKTFVLIDLHFLRFTSEIF